MSTKSVARKRPDKKGSFPKFDRTDSGNAERLAYHYGHAIRYVPDFPQFIVWRGTHWEVDVGEIEVGRFAKRVVKEIITAEVAEAKSRHRGPLRKWRHQSASRARRDAMVRLLATEDGMAIDYKELDQDAFLLSVENGTVDLKTGKLREHRSEDLITKLAPVAFDPKARCPRWEKFLREAMGGDEELVAYLQRFVGYSLSGSTKEHSLVFHYGDGNNGKSTFIHSIHRLLGEYATRAARGLLFRRRTGGEQHPTSIASLRGRRFVSCSEIDEDQEFDEALVKDLTGGDPLNARFMFQNEWVFEPTHKLWLAGNNKPKIRGTDRGIWRRMQLVPWSVTVTNIDKDLGEKLFLEAPGILNWAIAGCLAWQRRGLDPPPSVLVATAEYKKEQDVLGQFFDECLVFDQDARCARADLRTAYERWCVELGHTAVGAKKFAQALRKKHVADGDVWDNSRGQSVNGWAGVRFASQADRARRKLAEAADSGVRLKKKERARLREVIKLDEDKRRKEQKRRDEKRAARRARPQEYKQRKAENGVGSTDSTDDVPRRSIEKTASLGTSRHIGSRNHRSAPTHRNKATRVSGPTEKYRGTEAEKSLHSAHKAGDS